MIEDPAADFISSLGGLLERNHQDRVQLNAVWRNAFLTVQRIEECYARDSHRHIGRHRRISLYSSNRSKSLVERSSDGDDVIQEQAT